MRHALCVAFLLVFGVAIGDADRVSTAVAAEAGKTPSAGEGRPAGNRWGALEILGRTVEPGSSVRFTFVPVASYVQSFVDTLIVVTRGSAPGPTLCLTAGIHGDELNGVEIAHRVYANTNPHILAGTLIAVPIANAAGFRSGSRYLPDRRDLNRHFPGSSKGSTGARIANALFERFIRRCDALVDLHTGSFHRTNLPQIRTDLTDSRALDLASSFGVGIVLHGRGPKGSLRRAALDAGIPAVIYEAGEPLRFQEEEIDRGVVGVRNVMAHLGMLPGGPRSTGQSAVYQKTMWVRVSKAGGIFLTQKTLGEAVKKGDVLGTVTDPITEETEQVVAPVDGTIVGMAVPQLVLPGYALFHLGITELR